MADENKYYFDSEGKRVTGWFTKWSATYYADDEGIIQTGFVDIEDDTYYFKADGKMIYSTWITIDDNKYYSKANGCIAQSETIIRWGKRYTFNDGGNGPFQNDPITPSLRTIIVKHNII